ncbi:ABC transporter ATP-binding protein [Noviherbaspirillum cavernae]|uniref:ABC transporter ATP-binding protein n=1 Tax=Noviherbaspirillum cavernae TaxID=2320862 RepID=A0A418WVC4_9BURK|nr:ABC transporter ATP-binding protein [Noviherbaspirillum cavernae]RJF96511.1 ABC transporter ATP-binding protein [Noviherbaspirillum cavernae]
MSVLLEAKELGAGYGPLRIIRNINIKVPEKQLTVIVGPNGAGKTTLMRALSGILPLTEGGVTLAGAAVESLNVSRRVANGLVLVPEGRHLFAQMTVEENLELGGYLLRSSERRALKEQVLQLFPRLAERRQQLAGTMSGGEQQMVAVGRALMGKPKCMLLDEPSLGLAPKMVAELFRILKQICQSGTGVLLVEQNVRQALSICDHAYILEQGQVVAEGPGQELLQGERIRKSYLGM